MGVRKKKKKKKKKKRGTAAPIFFSRMLDMLVGESFLEGWVWGSRSTRFILPSFSSRFGHVACRWMIVIYMVFSIDSIPTDLENR